MRNKILISFFILVAFIIGSTSILFLYPERSQNYILESFNLKTLLNQKFENFIAKKINDENISVKIETIRFLKPNWPNIAKIKLKNINVYSLKQQRKSSIKQIEFGFSYDKLLKNLFLNENEIQFSYLNFRDLTLNAKIEKDKFTPGPLVKIFSLINQENLKTQASIKKILQSKFVIGNINLLLEDKREIFKDRLLEIKCEDAVLSEIIRKSRSLQMKCNQEENTSFLLNATLTESANIFSGVIKNFEPNLILNNWKNKNLYPLKIVGTSHLNGSFLIKTTKVFDIQSVNFVSDESLLITKNKEDDKIYETKFAGEISWEKKNNLLRFENLLLGDHMIASGEFDFISQRGTSNFSIKKLFLEDTKTYLKKIGVSSDIFLKLNSIKFFNYFEGGSLNNIRVNVNFSLEKEFVLDMIDVTSKFNNVKFEYNDKIFKKILSTISGDFKFSLNSQETQSPIINANFNASDGFVLIGDQNFRYKFNQAKIKGKFQDKYYLISKADFLKNNKLEYSFSNVKINKDNFKISKVEFIKDNKLRYILSNTTISSMRTIKSTLRVKNNREFSSFLKKKLNIELIGDANLDVNLTGNIKSLNFELDLDSNLTNSYLKINYLDLIKNKNITSSIKSKISFFEGKIAFLKNTHLYVGDKIYKIDLVEFNNKNTNEVLFENLHTPNLNIHEVRIFNDNKNLIIQATGKKIDLSSLNKNLKKNKDIILDLTADLIKLNSKITLTGNLKGQINGSVFKSIAYGKMLLGGAPLLDNGKFEIHVDNKISKLEGLGLVGGAETKINLQKQYNSFPNLIFDTSDGGKLLSALGFTQNVKSGDMKININFLNDGYDHYEGQIKSKKFSLINAPGIINSLSVLSFSGIGSIISGEGVFFDKGQVDIKVKNKIFNFDKLYLSSESLGISAKGSLNLKKQSINMTGSVAPIKLISKILSVVPAVGELLTGLKKEGLFAGQFKMQGQIQNPETKLNTMSFAPGILRDLFSEDWLDNKNFFLRDELNN